MFDGIILSLMSAKPTRLGKFDLLARIARGGMAEIYLARQHGVVGFSRLVVVKRILPHLAEESQFVSMFLEEARVAAMINHPNVVQIFDVGQSADDYYIAMEYIGGPSVAAICRSAHRRATVVPHAVAAGIVSQACEGLHAAHELCDDTSALMGLVHRDVSPQNLMVSDQGLVKLVDFGIAKAQNSSIRTRTGSIKGKYPYMSPEQCEGRALDRRTDIFSLGIVFFEMVTARRLFKRSTDLMTLKAITEEPLPTPLDFCDDLPQEIDRVIMHALSRDPGERYATAAEMGQDLRRFLGQREVNASSKLLQDYLHQQCQPLLDAKSRAIERLGDVTSPGPEVLDVDGLDDGSSIPSYAQATAVDSPSARRAKERSSPWRRLAIVAVVVIALATLGGLAYRLLVPSRPPGPALTFGFPPSFPAAVGKRELEPLLRHLEQGLGRRLKLVIPKDYVTLRRGLRRGTLHFVNLPPLQLVLARAESPKLRLLVTHSYEGARTYEGFIIAGHDSGITAIKHLKGKRFCYVDPGSTSGYLYVRQYLRANSLDPDDLFSATRFSGDHIAVMRDIVAGRCDAGAVYSGAFHSASSLDVASSRLRMVAVTGLLPYDAVCASGRLPAPLARKMRRLLLGFNPAKHLGRKILGPTFRISGFNSAGFDDFAKVNEAARAEGLLQKAEGP